MSPVWDDLFYPNKVHQPLRKEVPLMRYIILTGDGDRNFIAELQDNGEYKKIAQAFDNEAAMDLIQVANGSGD